MKNPEIFDQRLGVILQMLYDRFPVPCNLGFAGSDEMDCESESGHTDAEIQFHAMHWLANEGYIRYESCAVSEKLFLEVVLTEKALGALNSIPADLGSTESLGEIIATSVKEGATEKITDAVKSFIAVSAGYIRYKLTGGS